jgi:hypothetical protein
MAELDVAFRTGSLADIEQAGFEAGLKHSTAHANPYVEGSWEHEVWENGRGSGERLTETRYAAYR